MKFVNAALLVVASAMELAAYSTSEECPVTCDTILSLEDAVACMEKLREAGCDHLVSVRVSYNLEANNVLHCPDDTFAFVEEASRDSLEALHQKIVNITLEAEVDLTNAVVSLVFVAADDWNANECAPISGDGVTEITFDQDCSGQICVLSELTADGLEVGSFRLGEYNRISVTVDGVQVEIKTVDVYYDNSEYVASYSSTEAGESSETTDDAGETTDDAEETTDDAEETTDDAEETTDGVVN